MDTYILSAKLFGAGRSQAISSALVLRPSKIAVNGFEDWKCKERPAYITLTLTTKAKPN